MVMTTLAGRGPRVRRAMRALLFVVAALSFLFAGCGGGETTDASGGESGSSSGRAPSSGLRTVTIEASGGEEARVRVEIADEPEEQARGLMGRTALGEDRGMLFAFGEEEVRSFWMKDTLIPLSIAYMDAEGRIVDIQDIEPLDDEEPHYVSKEPARYALEVNRGFFDERGVEVGDRAELPG